ncbi:DUF3261 domain-containing protein [Aliivibrio salmonicida]|uniref:Lipoprotein n=1 Tax=Aliivibrio salmonicida (strain LFI1238) TaxID=316275 RepID=B6EI40_ALISL|nr:DUF3261 domain-containing protein [Aliivibrio salmonicida]AZL85263.1 DUF3261 domain-containing protein [Aliivibrio salmonicida]CAQ79778.1 putative lipoprotein [Aliivibrio salmonicida LFI1238]
MKRISLRLIHSIIFIVSLSLLGCASAPIKKANQVEVSPEQFVTLPQPNQYGSDISLSQLISVNWHGGKQQLPVQLQLTGNKLVLAGFASWGSRILSLDYDGQTLNTYVMAGLSETLPPPEQVLFNVMITLWPAEAWKASLDSIGWSLQDIGNQRVLSNDFGKTILIIDYSSIEDKLSGDIILTSPHLGYVITIKTFANAQSVMTKKKNG